MGEWRFDQLVDAGTALGGGGNGFGSTMVSNSMIYSSCWFSLTDEGPFDPASLLQVLLKVMDVRPLPPSISPRCPYPCEPHRRSKEASRTSPSHLQANHDNHPITAQAPPTSSSHPSKTPYSTSPPQPPPTHPQAQSHPPPPYSPLP